jgi:hypothetical protein
MMRPVATLIEGQGRVAVLGRENGRTMKPKGKCAVTSGSCWLCGRPATIMSARRPGSYEHPACRKEADKTAEEATAVENAERAEKKSP